MMTDEWRFHARMSSRRRTISALSIMMALHVGLLAPARVRSEPYLLSVPLRRSCHAARRALNLARGGDDGGSNGPNIRIFSSLAQIERVLQSHIHVHAEDGASLGTSTPLIVLYFTANNCPPCKMIGPIYEDLSALTEFENVQFYKVNVSDFPDVAERFNVDGWPTFLLFKDGKVVDSIVGGIAAKEGLYSLIARHAS